MEAHWVFLAGLPFPTKTEKMNISSGIRPNGQVRAIGSLKQQKNPPPTNKKE